MSAVGWDWMIEGWDWRCFGAAVRWRVPGFAVSAQAAGMSYREFSGYGEK